MKIFNTLLIFNSLLITISTIMCFSCSNNKESDGTHGTFQPENNDLGKAKTVSYGNSKTFEEFLSRKSEIELYASSTRVDKTFDNEEAVELVVELYNPRHLSFETYRNTLGSGQSAPEFRKFVVGSPSNPWYENLTLYMITENKETQLEYALKNPVENNELNIGQGDIGSLGLILKPGTIHEEGNINLLLKYKEPPKDLKLSTETWIRLKKDHADELQKKISSIYYHIASNETEEALKMSLETVKSSPNSYHANVLLGEINEQMGNLNDALKAYQDAIILFRNDSDIRIVEYPEALWDKINELELKVENEKK